MPPRRRLKVRTLTKRYDARPQWLKLAHEKLDRAVVAAYPVTDPAGNWSEEWASVWAETGAGQPLPENHPLGAERKRVDQLVLANLVRLNLQSTRVGSRPPCGVPIPSPSCLLATAATGPGGNR